MRATTRAKSLLNARKPKARTTRKPGVQRAKPATRSARKPSPRVSKPRIASVNPATGQVLQIFEPYSEREIETRLQRATEAVERQRHSSFEQRAQAMERAADILETESSDLALIMTREMGKPVRAAVEEAKKCALACRYYAANAARFLAKEETSAQTAHCFVRFEPLGAVLAIMPWNFPFWQVFRFAAPALMAGNVGLLKHASNVPQCALAIEDIFQRAGFPEGAFQALLIGSEQVGRLIEDSRVRAVTLTGSVGAGSSVASAAGKQIKKTVLELGGSDPFIVMPSADLEAAARMAVRARTINNGQSCIAAKRFIIDRRIAPEFEREFIQRMASLKVGDPMDEGTDIGPLATPDVLKDLAAQVDKTVRMGFSFKWNMGWMHDTLEYFRRDPIHRRYHQNDLTFAMLYHHHENFILPLSHDEVVHGKSSLLGRMPGDDWRRFANLRALLGYQWTFPGKMLLFMGGELGQSSEWNANGEADWRLLEAGPYHKGLQRFVQDLNRLYAEEKALWRADYDPAGFYWIDTSDHANSILSFCRQDAEGRSQLVAILNLTPVVRQKYRVGLPSSGNWREVLNSDAAVYGGSNVGNLGGVTTSDYKCHGQPCSAEFTLPPLSIMVFKPAPPPGTLLR